MPRHLVSLLASTLLCLPAHAQTITASLGGAVRDPSGAAVPNAKVRLVNTATGVETGVETATDGSFLAPSLPPGPYSLAAEAPGFKRAQRTGIVLEVNQSARLDLTLEVGAVTETVEVSASALLLETATSAVGQVISNRSIVNLPLNQRNPYALVLLAPGVHGNIGFQFNNMNFSVNGGRPGSNEILIDGIPSSPPLVNPIQGFSVFPSVDAVQEFKVQSNNYSAEFGRSGGSVVNLIYKSGTNQLHGSLFEFLRNSVLDANDFFANSRGVKLGSFKRNQFGASAGGPVVIPRLVDGRNRTFFFVTYEGLRQRAAENLLTTAPTALQRAGDFSQTRNAAGQLIVIHDPVTTTASGSGFTRQAFPGNRLPANRIDAVANNVTRYFPLPNAPGDPNSGTNNYAAQGSGLTDINQLDVKADENLNERHRFFARFSRRNLNIVPANNFPADIAIANGAFLQPQYSTGAAFDYTWNLRPTFLMNFRAGFGRILLAFRPISDGFDPTQLGLPSYIAANADRIMFPGFGPQGYISVGNGGPQFRRNSFETHNWSLNNTKVLARHSLRFGFEARLLRVHNTEAGSAAGNYTFTRSITQGPDPNRATANAGDGLASFLLGIGGGVYTKGFKGVSTQSTYYGWYIADDWKLSARLTLNLGLRYELDVPRTERYNRMNYFDALAPSPLAGPAGLAGLTGGLVFVGVEGRDRRQFPTDRDNWAPRFGFAYQATRRLVLRGAYGIFYAPPQSAAGGTVGNFGFRSDTTYVGSQDGLTPTNYLRNPFPDGFVPIPGASQGLLTAAGAPISSPLRSTVVPYMQNWTLNTQYELPGDWLVEAGYIGTRGLQLTRTGEGTANLNQLRAEQLALGPQLQQRVRNPFFGLITTGPLATATVPQSFLLRAFPQFTTINPLYASGGSSTYHSCQLKAERRFRTGLNLLAAYTFAKLIDDFSIISNVGRNANQQNIFDPRNERSVSANDVSNRLVISYVYDLPFGRGRRFGGGMPGALEALLGGWQINGITTLQAGQPLALTTQDTSQSGGNVLRPNNSGQSGRLEGPTNQRLRRYFDTSAFSQPAPFTFGNTGRTLPDARGPGVHNFDFSLFKNFRAWGERASLQFRAEFFNLFNTPTFGFPNQNLSAVQFGQISGQANDPRQVQFGIKLLW